LQKPCNLSDMTQDLSMLEQAENLFDLGGPVALVLVTLSIVAFAIILVKVWQFKTMQIGHFEAAREALGFYRRGLVSEALDLCTTRGIRWLWLWQEPFAVICDLYLIRLYAKKSCVMGPMRWSPCAAGSGCWR